MFKLLVLQQLHNLSDDRIEYQIRDRLSFMRFLRLSLEDRVPDAKTVWVFREHLKRLKLIDVLFARFHEQLAAQGYVAQAGQMIDASTHDSQVFDELLDKNEDTDGNKRALYADSAYRSKAKEEQLAADKIQFSHRLTRNRGGFTKKSYSATK